MTIEQAISKSVAGGWIKGKTLDISSTGLLYEKDGEEYEVLTAEMFLDPAFWRALGAEAKWGRNPADLEAAEDAKRKAGEAKDSFMSQKLVEAAGIYLEDYLYGDWRKRMTALMKHLAWTDGGTIESYFETL